jgi:hypothetical protein
MSRHEALTREKDVDDCQIVLFFSFQGLLHRFLYEGLRTPKGSVERVKGVSEDHRKKIIVPISYMDSRVNHYHFLKILGVRGFLAFMGPRIQIKRLKNPMLLD